MLILKMFGPTHWFRYLRVPPQFPTFQDVLLLYSSVLAPLLQNILFNFTSLRSLDYLTFDHLIADLGEERRRAGTIWKIMN